MTSYVVGSDLPDLAITWYDSSGNLVDFSSGWTFTAKVAPVNSTVASFTKTTSITGAATAPNLTISWATTGELNSLTAGSYTVQVKANRTSDNRDRYNPEPIVINLREVIQ